MGNSAFASDPYTIGRDRDPAANIPAEECTTKVVSHVWVNSEYKLLVLRGSPKALAVKPGQFFNILCPSPDDGELWLRRPQSIFQVDRAAGHLEFLYKCAGRGTKGMATLQAGDDCNIVGPLGIGFSLKPEWRNVVVLGRGVGLATLGPISQLAAENGVGVTAILSARSPELVMVDHVFGKVGDVIRVLDTDGSSAVENVERVLEQLITAKKADAFFTCGSYRLMLLMKTLARRYGIHGPVGMEQNMAYGFGPCYVDVKAFKVNAPKASRRVS